MIVSQGLRRASRKGIFLKIQRSKRWPNLFRNYYQKHLFDSPPLVAMKKLTSAVGRLRSLTGELAGVESPFLKEK
jgi:hypothetical protein